MIGTPTRGSAYARAHARATTHAHAHEHAHAHVSPLPGAHRPYQALTQLDLDSNVLGDEGAAALAAALGGCALRVLRLHDNGVADAGAAALAGALPTSALELLALGDNPVGAAGAAALARAARTAPSLRLLDLRGAEPQARLHPKDTAARPPYCLYTRAQCIDTMSCSACAAGARDGAGGRRRMRDMPRALRSSRLSGFVDHVLKGQPRVGLHTGTAYALGLR